MFREVSFSFPAENEITVAVEALRDLRSQNNEGLDSSTTDRKFVPTKEKASVPTTEKASALASVPITEKANALASVSDHRDVIVPGVSSQTVSKDTTTTGEVSGQAGKFEDMSHNCHTIGYCNAYLKRVLLLCKVTFTLVR